MKLVKIIYAIFAKISHNNHCIKSYFEIIPTKKDEESNKENVKKFKEHIKEIFYMNEFILKDVKQRSKILIEFLAILLEINDTIFQNYNKTLFDYYNYENIKYISNLVKNEKIMEKDNYFCYLLFGEELTINKNEIKNNLYHKNNKERKNNKIILSNLNYFKDNLFIANEEKLISMNEFKNFSFNHLASYDTNKLGKIHFIKPAKFKNNIFINFKNKKNIKILEFIEEYKSFKLYDEEIKSKKEYPQNNFIDCIDNKNGNILTLDNNGEIIIWKKKDKEKKYNEILNIKGTFENLFNINDLLFGLENKNKIIQIFNSDNYELIKNINFNCSVNFVGNIINKIIIFSSFSKNQIFLVDQHYLEIVQTIQLENNYYYIGLKNNNLLIFYVNNENVLKIHKKCFNIKESNFIDSEFFELKKEFSNRLNIIISNNDYIILNNQNKIIILKF